MSSSSGSLGFLTNTNADYIADIYARYLDDPESVDSSWVSFFDDLDDDARSILNEMDGASWDRGLEPLRVSDKEVDPKKSKGGGIDVKSIEDSLRAYRLINAYRVRGHLIADLDPLGLKKKDTHPELTPEFYGFSVADFDREIILNGLMGVDKATLREIISACRKTYCGKIGIEYTHIQDPAQKQWMQERIEAGLNRTAFSDEGKKGILKALTKAEGFENFLHVKYPGTKRFGIDGGEAMVPAIEQIIKRGGQLGLKEIVIGMAHRGRLNVLTNVMGKSFTSMFSLFMGKTEMPESIEVAGDVKYHLGASDDREFEGNSIHLSLNANPSHLEAVNPVVAGKVRSKQAQRGGGDEGETQVLSLLLHGDAAFAGQGLVAETLMISEIDGYAVGGTIHFVINNQIGFTTSPHSSRSGPYCTDVAKMIQAPIIHVTGDDPEAVVHAARIAIEYRQKFKKDVVVDMFCYRRNGHNEGDEPMFTQPLMYKEIKKHPTTRTLYAESLVREGLLSESEAKKIVDEFNEGLEEAFKAAENYNTNEADMLEGKWSGLKLAEKEGARRGKTGISYELAQKIGKALTTVPDDFDLNKKIERQLKQKEDMFKSGQDFDWATAEALAFGSLAAEGFPVRLSGQDCQRGTFSQRHSVLHDQTNDNEYEPLNNITDDQAKYSVYNSPLSEAAVLGFEYGYSLAEPRALVMWEAQFGDFVNGAQVLIDQFIVSSETKWLRMSGLVMLLPHGHEGQGPEHTSARPERFLQMCAEDNIQIANCTTPANYFHILRRQMHREFRKPLIIMTPKSLLRHKLAVSPLEMMLDDQTFHRVLHEDEPLCKDKDVKRVVLCSGKVYYDLFQKREELGIKNIALVRLEQLYPFPDDALADELKRYPKADVVWCQEEPMNQGSWHFVDRRIERTLADIKHKTSRPVFVGRPDAASPATGHASTHKAEQDRLLTQALTLK